MVWGKEDEADLIWQFYVTVVIFWLFMRFG